MMRSELLVTPVELSRNDLTSPMEKNELVQIIKKVYGKYGYINRTILKSEISDFDVEWQLSKYGGLKALCKEYNLTYRQYSQIPPEQIVEDAKNVLAAHGKLDLETYLEYGQYSKQTIKTNFGGFNKLLKAIGVKENTTRLDSKEDVVSDFKKYYEEYHSVSSSDYRKHGKYSESVINRLFGSWCNFIEYLGLMPVNKKTGTVQMLDEIQELFNEYGYLSARLVNDNCSFTYQALRHYYSMEEISEILGVDNAFENNKRLSAGAKILHKVLNEIYGACEVISEYSEGWLLNPKTHKRMYVDYYIPNCKTAFEYDGEQHYKYIPYIHKNYRNFFNQVYRDRAKERTLKAKGIKLIRIKYNEPLSKEYVLSRIIGE